MSRFELTRSLRALALVSVAVLATAPALAAFPEKPITVMVGFGAGGGADTLARLVAKDAEKRLGQPLVIENVPGGGGVVAATKLMNSAPDGYTIGMAVTSTLTYPPLASKNVKYRADSFDPITSVAVLQNAVVAKGDAPFSTLAEMIAAAKSGRKLSFATSSPAVTLVMEHVAAQAGIELKIVPVKGGAEAMKEILGGHIDMGWSAGVHQKYLKDNSLKVIVASARHRLATTPDVPTFRELGYAVGSDTHFLFFAPKGIPPDVFNKLVDALSAAARSDEVKRLAQEKMDFPSSVLTPAELRQEITEETATTKALIEAAAKKTSK
jgi:tripartite-type tricarboxylate transporter receptor subunit TctC